MFHKIEFRPVPIISPMHDVNIMSSAGTALAEFPDPIKDILINQFSIMPKDFSTHRSGDKYFFTYNDDTPTTVKRKYELLIAEVGTKSQNNTTIIPAPWSSEYEETF